MKDESKNIVASVETLEDVNAQTIALEEPAISLACDDSDSFLPELDVSGPTIPPIDGGVIGLGGNDDDDDDNNEDGDADGSGEHSFLGFEPNNEDTLLDPVLVGAELGTDSETHTPFVPKGERIESGWVVCLMVGLLFVICGFGTVVNEIL